MICPGTLAKTTPTSITKQLFPNYEERQHTEPGKISGLPVKTLDDQNFMELWLEQPPSGEGYSMLYNASQSIWHVHS